jgi:phosphatidylserine/phosphatidylglycerophosphate/cardiolipin synthase-like enzyme
MARNMKHSAIVLACVLTILGFVATPLMSASLETPGTTEVFFSPNGGATDAVVREITTAREEIFILAYSFTSKPIAVALLAAHKRGVKIIAVLDKRQRREKYSTAALISNAGIPVLIDTHHAIAHNKVMIMDRSTLITGSFNFTAAAEGKNAENLLVMKGNQPLVDQYLRNFEAHKEHSVPYESKEGERVEEPGFPTLFLDGKEPALSLSKGQDEGFLVGATRWVALL